MTHPIYRYSAIARPLEAKYRTNLAVMILAPAAGLALAGVALFIRGAGPLAALLAFVAGALVAFLAWALGREVDPDRNAAAFIAMALAVLALAAGHAPAIWTLAFALMAARLVNRTVGPPARLTDAALVLALAAMAVFRDGYLAMGLVAALAFALDGLLDRTRPLSFVLALAGVAISAVGYALGGFDGEVLADFTRGWLWGAILIAALFAYLTLTCPPLVSRCDAIDEGLDRRRVQGAMLVVLAAAGASLLAGPAGHFAALPVWAVLAGAVLARWTSRGARPEASA